MAKKRVKERPLGELAAAMDDNELADHFARSSLHVQYDAYKAELLRRLGRARAGHAPEEPDEEADMFKALARFASALEHWVGQRCPDFEPGCYACQVWGLYDQIKEKLESTLERP